MANKQDSCTGGGQGTHYFNRWVVDLLHAAPRHLSVSVLTALCWHNPRRRCRRDLDLVVTPGYVLIRHRPTTANSLRSNRPESPTGFLFQHSNRRTFLLLSWFPFLSNRIARDSHSLSLCIAITSNHADGSPLGFEFHSLALSTGFQPAAHLQ